jgi:hypothetical protein
MNVDGIIQQVLEKFVDGCTARGCLEVAPPRRLTTDFARDEAVGEYVCPTCGHEWRCWWSGVLLANPEGGVFSASMRDIFSAHFPGGPSRELLYEWKADQLRIGL